MEDLGQLSAAALARPAEQPAILASGAGPGARVAFVARNRPSALAALLGMIAGRCTIRMVYPFQSATAIARELAEIEPSVLVAAAEDFPETILAESRSSGIAAIALREMDACSLPGLEHARHALGVELAGEHRLVP